MNWLFVLFEMFGTVGSQCEDVMFRLIGKQSGVGKRGIGEFRSLFLVWQRSRRPLVREWDATHANDGAFSVASGRSPTDAVWRQAVRQEHGVHSDQVAATVLWDVKQFYDSMWLRHFFAEGQSHSHPSAVLRLSLASYTWPRILQIDDVAANPLVAHQSIVAGAAFGTFEAKLYVLNMVRQQVIEHPRVPINVHIDDVGFDVVDKGPSKLGAVILRGVLRCARSPGEHRLLSRL